MSSSGPKDEAPLPAQNPDTSAQAADPPFASQEPLRLTWNQADSEFGEWGFWTSRIADLAVGLPGKGLGLGLGLWSRRKARRRTAGLGLKLGWSFGF